MSEASAQARTSVVARSPAPIPRLRWGIGAYVFMLGRLDPIPEPRT